MGIPSWAVPGAKVVCVRQFGLLTYNDLGIRQYPDVGGIYEIVAARINDTPEGRLVFVRLAGFDQRQTFRVDGFRPLVTQYTEQHDVAKLKHLLTSKESADA